jgi:ATP phosphoribosyltransferase
VTRRSPSPAGDLLSVAIPKGRLLEEASKLFERALGVSPSRLLENTRKLAADAPEHGLRFISIRAADVASYVEHGAADVGVAGLDVLREEPRDLYEPLDLGIGRCQVIVGRPRNARPLPRGVAPRVATKYVNLAARHFARKGIPAEIIALARRPDRGHHRDGRDPARQRARHRGGRPRGLGPPGREPGRPEAPCRAAPAARRGPPIGDGGLTQAPRALIRAPGSRYHHPPTPNQEQCPVLEEDQFSWIAHAAVSR